MKTREWRIEDGGWRTRSVVECGGKRSATPLSELAASEPKRRRRCPPSAVPLRRTGALPCALYRFTETISSFPFPGLRPPSPHFVGRGQGEGLVLVPTEFHCEMVLDASGGREQRASGSPSPPLEERAGERKPTTLPDAAVPGKAGRAVPSTPPTVVDLRSAGVGSNTPGALGTARPTSASANDSGSGA